MNATRILLGGIVGGVVFNGVSALIHTVILMGRYQVLQQGGHVRDVARIPYLPAHMALLFLVSIGLVWLYAAARQRLGPGPKTALLVGLVVGLIAGMPTNLALFAWAKFGGFVGLFWTLEQVIGCALATLVGAWIYRE